MAGYRTTKPASLPGGKQDPVKGRGRRYSPDGRGFTSIAHSLRVIVLQICVPEGPKAFGFFVEEHLQSLHGGR